MYKNLNKENGVKFELKQDVLVDSDKVDKVMYETAISSISTNTSNYEGKVNDKETNKEVRYIWPVEGEILKEHSLERLAYSKTLNMWQIHSGIDIKANLGDSVQAISSGIVIQVNKDNFYGNTIKIEHEDGYVSVYSNLVGLQNIKVGDKVKMGALIGRIGNSASGEAADKPHLHFEVLKNNEKINPIEILE